MSNTYKEKVELLIAEVLAKNTQHIVVYDDEGIYVENPHTQEAVTITVHEVDEPYGMV